jgi:hypothetical protein
VSDGFAVKMQLLDANVTMVVALLDGEFVNGADITVPVNVGVNVVTLYTYAFRTKPMIAPSLW